MKTLIIGYGSIGERHSNVLKNLGCEIGILSKRKLNLSNCYFELKTALEKFCPDYVIISNPTSDHYMTLKGLDSLGYEGLILIEKPIFHKLQSIKEKFIKDKIFVAYNLRFHPLIQMLEDNLVNEEIISINAYVGQYLPSWRKNRNYEKVYSSIKEKGGGVLRDLSHELDYIIKIAGDWKKVTAIGGKFSELKIDSDDTFSILAVLKNCNVCSININYLDKLTRRNVIINTKKNTFELDFINGLFKKNDLTEKVSIDGNYTYKKMHEEIIKKSFKNVCTFNEGISVLKMIESSEQSCINNRVKWITNE